jgi:hypothetical protein
MPKRTYREFKQGQFKPINKQKCLNKTNPEYRSGLEMKVMTVLDKNPNVLEWSSEMIVIPYIHPVKTAQSGSPQYSRYFVDFYIKLKVGETVKELVVEVKPKKQCSKPQAHGNKKTSTLLYENVMWAVNQAKWEAATAYCKKKNYIFVIRNEDNIDSILST